MKFPLAFNVEKAYINQGFSDDSEEEIPVLVPNTEVKLFCADDSWLRACENRTLLSLFLCLKPMPSGIFFFGNLQKKPLPFKRGHRSLLKHRFCHRLFDRDDLLCRVRAVQRQRFGIQTGDKLFLRVQNIFEVH